MQRFFVESENLSLHEWNRAWKNLTAIIFRSSKTIFIHVTSRDKQKTYRGNNLINRCLQNFLWGRNERVAFKCLKNNTIFPNKEQNRSDLIFFEKEIINLKLFVLYLSESLKTVSIILIWIIGYYKLLICSVYSRRVHCKCTTVYCHRLS